MAQGDYSRPHRDLQSQQTTVEDTPRATKPSGCSTYTSSRSSCRKSFLISSWNSGQWRIASMERKSWTKAILATREKVSIVLPKHLSEALRHQSSFKSINLANIEGIKPTSTYGGLFRRKRNQIPSITTLESTHLVNHCMSPF